MARNFILLTLLAVFLLTVACYVFEYLVLKNPQIRREGVATVVVRARDLLEVSADDKTSSTPLN